MSAPDKIGGWAGRIVERSVDLHAKRRLGTTDILRSDEERIVVLETALSSLQEVVRKMQVSMIGHVRAARLARSGAAQVKPYFA